MQDAVLGTMILDCVREGLNPLPNKYLYGAANFAVWPPDASKTGLLAIEAF